MIELNVAGFRHFNEQEADFGCHPSTTHTDLSVVDCRLYEMPSELDDLVMQTWKRRVGRLFNEAVRQRKKIYARFSVHVNDVALPLPIIEDALFTLEYLGFSYTIIDADEDISFVRDYLLQFDKRSWFQYDGPVRARAGLSFTKRRDNSQTSYLPQLGAIRPVNEQYEFLRNTLGNNKTHFGLRPSYFYDTTSNRSGSNNVGRFMDSFSPFGHKEEVTVTYNDGNCYINNLNNNHKILLKSSTLGAGLTTHNEVTHTVEADGVNFNIPENFGIDSWIDTGILSTFFAERGGWCALWFKAEDLTDPTASKVLDDYIDDHVPQRILSIGGSTGARTPPLYALSTNIAVGFKGNKLQTMIRKFSRAWDYFPLPTTIAPDDSTASPKNRVVEAKQYTEEGPRVYTIEYSLEDLIAMEVPNITLEDGEANWKDKWHQIIVDVVPGKYADERDNNADKDGFWINIYLNGVLIRSTNLGFGGNGTWFNTVLLGGNYGYPQNSMTQAGHFNGYVTDFVTCYYPLNQDNLSQFWETYRTEGDFSYSKFEPQIDDIILATEPDYYLPLVDTALDAHGYRKTETGYEYEVLGTYSSKQPYFERPFYGIANYFSGTSVVTTNIPTNEIFFGGHIHTDDELEDGDFPEGAQGSVAFWINKKNFDGERFWGEWTGNWGARHHFITATSSSASDSLWIFDIGNVRGDSLMRTRHGHDSHRGGDMYLTRAPVSDDWVPVVITFRAVRRVTSEFTDATNVYKIYVDGKLFSSGTTVRSSGASTSFDRSNTPFNRAITDGLIAIGGFPAGHQHNTDIPSAHAAISHVCFYKRELTEQEARQLSLPMSYYLVDQTAPKYEKDHWQVYRSTAEFDRHNKLKDYVEPIVYNQPAIRPLDFANEPCFRTKPTSRELFTYDFGQDVDLSSYDALDVLYSVEQAQYATSFIFTFYDSEDNALLNFETLNSLRPHKKGLQRCYVGPICRPLYFSSLNELQQSTRYNLPANCRKFKVELMTNYRMHEYASNLGLKIHSITANKYAYSVNSKTNFHYRDDDTTYFDMIRLKEYVDDTTVLLQTPRPSWNNPNTLFSYNKLSPMLFRTTPGSLTSKEVFNGASDSYVLRRGFRAPFGQGSGAGVYFFPSSDFNGDFAVHGIMETGFWRFQEPQRDPALIPLSHFFMISKNETTNYYDFVVGISHPYVVVHYYDVSNPTERKVLTSANLSEFINEDNRLHQFVINYKRDTRKLEIWFSRLIPTMAVNAVNAKNPPLTKVIDVTLDHDIVPFNDSQTFWGRYTLNEGGTDYLSTSATWTHNENGTLGELITFERYLTEEEIQKLKAPEPCEYYTQEDRVKESFWYSYREESCSYVPITSTATNHHAMTSIGTTDSFKTYAEHAKAPLLHNYFRFNEPAHVDELYDEGYDGGAKYINRKKEYFWREDKGLCLLAELDNGTPRYVETNFSGNRLNNNDFTIACFFKKPVLETPGALNNRLFTAFNPLGNTGFAFGLDGDDLKIWIGNQIAYTIPEKIEADKWYHLCLTYTKEALLKSTGQVFDHVWKVYLDGKQHKQGDIQSVFQPDALLRLYTSPDCSGEYNKTGGLYNGFPVYERALGGFYVWKGNQSYVVSPQIGVAASNQFWRRGLGGGLDGLYARAATTSTYKGAPEVITKDSLEPYHPDNITFQAELPILSNELKCMIGNGPGNTTFNGYIDDFLIFDRVLRDRNSQFDYLDPEKARIFSHSYLRGWGYEIELLSEKPL